MRRQATKKPSKLTKEVICDLCSGLLNGPVTLDCHHNFCRHCLEQEYKVRYLKGGKQRKDNIKCPTCGKVTALNPELGIKSLPDNEKLQQSVDAIQKLKLGDAKSGESKESNESMGQTKERVTGDSKAKCEICRKKNAEYECLNCDFIACGECKKLHVSKPRHKNHKIIKFVPEDAKADNRQGKSYGVCRLHREEHKLYCYDCEVFCCIVCAFYEDLHPGHNVKSIQVAVEKAGEEKEEVMLDLEEKLSAIQEEVEVCQEMRNNLDEEREYFLELLHEEFDKLADLLRKRKMEVERKIHRIFDEQMDEINTRFEGYTAITKRYEKVKLVYEKKNDLEFVQMKGMITQLTKDIEEIETKVDHYKNDLRHSFFKNVPIDSFQQNLQSFDFQPLRQEDLDLATELFKESTVLDSEMLQPRILTCFPRFDSGRLLYRASINGASSRKFHHYCDEQGPTLTILKTADGYVFGGYCPLSYEPVSKYSTAKDAYLFSLTDGKGRQPILMPVRSDKIDRAIKQNEPDFSPGFGEIDISDLFIAFKSLDRSYSKVGAVYELPQGYKGDTILAGKSKNWEIEDVEVYALEPIEIPTAKVEESEIEDQLPESREESS